MDIWDHANGVMARADYTYGVGRTTRNPKYPCLIEISMRITYLAKNRHADNAMRAGHGNGLQHRAQGNEYTPQKIDTFSAPNVTNVTNWDLVQTPLIKPSVSYLTYWGRDKMAAIVKTTFSNAFYWMKMYGFRFQCHWRWFLGVQLTQFQHWFRQWLGADQGTTHHMNPWWLSLVTHMCVTRPQCVKLYGYLTLYQQYVQVQGP